MSYGAYAGIDAAAFRVTRLDNNGNPVRGAANGALLYCCAARVSVEPQVTDGQDILKEGYCAGRTCAKWTTPDRIDAYRGTLDVCLTSDELQELVNWTTPLLASGNIRGSLYYTKGGCDDVSIDNGVAIEFWYRPVGCDEQISTSGTPVWRKLVIPRAYNFIKAEAWEVNGTDLQVFTWRFKMRPPGTAFEDGPFREDDILWPTANPTAPPQTWQFADYETLDPPPTCAGVEPNEYVATPT